MDFPTTEPDIMALSQKMLDGYFWYATDFPKVIRPKLYAFRTGYIGARQNHKRKHADLRIASKAAKEALQELVQVMKNCLQKSEVDTASNPEKAFVTGMNRINTDNSKEKVNIKCNPMGESMRNNFVLVYLCLSHSSVVLLQVTRFLPDCRG